MELAEELEDIKSLIKDLNGEIKEIKNENRVISLTLAKQEANIAHHIYRTDKLEQLVEQNKKESESRDMTLQNEIEPLSKRAAMFDGAMKFLGISGSILGVLGTLAYGAFELLKKLGVI